MTLEERDARRAATLLAGGPRFDWGRGLRSMPWYVRDRVCSDLMARFLDALLDAGRAFVSGVGASGEQHGCIWDATVVFGRHRVRLTYFSPATYSAASVGGDPPLDLMNVEHEFSAQGATWVWSR